MRRHRAFLILLAFAAALFLSDIWIYKEFVRAESYFALGARLMIEQHDWLAPHAPDEGQLNKPPLTFWLIGSSYKGLTLKLLRNPKRDTLLVVGHDP